MTENSRPRDRSDFGRREGGRYLGSSLSIILGFITFQVVASSPPRAESLEDVLRSSDLTILADVKHGVWDRVSFFSSTALFEAMTRAGVRHLAIEMPRVLGSQAMTECTRVETHSRHYKQSIPEFGSAVQEIETHSL